MKSIILGFATLVMVLTGLSVVLFVSCLPTIEYLLLLAPSSSIHHDENSTWWKISAVAIVTAALQFLHLWLLWKFTFYFSLFRKLMFPIRKLVMPLAMLIVRIECVREETPVLYLDLSTIPNVSLQQQHQQQQQQLDLDPAEEIRKTMQRRLLMSFRRSVRRRYRTMEETFRSKHITIKSMRSETNLNLSKVIPIIWNHERRCCVRDEKSNVVAEFIKRVLVVVLTTNGILDEYYNEDNNLVGIQLSVQQGNVWHWFMYFSTDTQSGIWYHGILNAMIRGMNDPSVRYLNAQNHQTDSKIGAGLQHASYNDDRIMTQLYPLTFLTDLREDAIVTRMWQ